MDLTDIEWRKSLRSGSNGGDCVEVGAVWRKSSYSNGGQQGSCVEVADANFRDAVAVRDSKDPGGPVLTFSRGEWAGFVRRVCGPGSRRV